MLSVTLGQWAIGRNEDKQVLWGIPLVEDGDGLVPPGELVGAHRS